MGIKIKLMADYGCEPLWWADEDKVGNIQPETLPLTDETIKRLQKWAIAYSETLNWSDPANSPGFGSEEARKAFAQEGISLWKQLRQELAPDYEVIYFSEQLGELCFSPEKCKLLGK
ncbi:MAG: hypothetical protein SAL07_06945 [Oscillatoria sp. PMC 1051.18]|nr:hypothetical protein [Oscillatoria sp. PMC 1050.18]MEC5029634.1 hypothetical protein [Oscillatoria sp. PMC 1051.18]